MISIQMKLQACFANHLPITGWNSCSFGISIKNVDYNFALERQAEDRKDKYHAHMHRIQLKMYCEFKVTMGTNLANFHSHFIPLLTTMTYTFTGKNSNLQLPLLLNIHIWTSNSHTVSYWHMQSSTISCMACNSLPFHGCPHLLGLAGHLSGGSRSSSSICFLRWWSFFSSSILTSTAATATARSTGGQGIWRHCHRGWWSRRHWS